MRLKKMDGRGSPDADRSDAIATEWARERPDIDAFPMTVVARIQRVSQALKPLLDGAQEPFGLKGESFDVLASLRRAGEPYELSPTALYSELMITSGTMTNRLDRLEAASLIARRPDPSDGRGTLVALSKKGRALIDRALGDHAANEATLLSALTHEELESLSALLRKLLLSWDDL
jgi:DNA-binding MarR family transcriptional regulator